MASVNPMALLALVALAMFLRTSTNYSNYRKTVPLKILSANGGQMLRKEYVSFFYVVIFIKVFDTHQLFSFSLSPN